MSKNDSPDEITDLTQRIAAARQAERDAISAQTAARLEARGTEREVDRHHDNLCAILDEGVDSPDELQDDGEWLERVRHARQKERQAEEIATDARLAYLECRRARRLARARIAALVDDLDLPLFPLPSANGKAGSNGHHVNGSAARPGRRHRKGAL